MEVPAPVGIQLLEYLLPIRQVCKQLLFLWAIAGEGCGQFA